jgi:hypothetical protein
MDIRSNEAVRIARPKRVMLVPLSLVGPRDARGGWSFDMDFATPIDIMAATAKPATQASAN